MLKRLYDLPFPIIGLTGGVASGKSSVSFLLKRRGVSLLSADELVKKIYARAETLEWLREQHWDVFDEIGNIHFKKLRQLFFHSKEIQHLVENFIYARLEEVFRQSLAQLDDKNPSFLVYDVPLLFEKNYEKSFDKILLVYTPETIQKERLIKRDHIEEELAESMLRSQINIENKKEMAHYIIDNSMDGIDQLDREVDFFLYNLKKNLSL